MSSDLNTCVISASCHWVRRAQHVDSGDVRCRPPFFLVARRRSVRPYFDVVCQELGNVLAVGAREWRGDGARACRRGVLGRASSPGCIVGDSCGRASAALHLALPGVADLTGPPRSFRGHGKLTVAAERVRLPAGLGLTAAGRGIEVTISGVKLTGPLTIGFDITGKAAPGDIAVVAHELPGGSWSLDQARVTGGQMSVRAASFSVHVPAWLNPKAWLHWLGGRLASVVGGRTPPIPCAGGGPAWASLSSSTDEAHTCLVSNMAPVSQVTRAEAQIKSNRGYVPASGGCSTVVTIGGRPGDIGAASSGRALRQVPGPGGPMPGMSF